MSIYRISTFIAYDHEQGAFMFYDEATAHMKMLPAQYISEVEAGMRVVKIICNTKHHVETFDVKSKDPESDVEKIKYLLDEF